MSEESKTERTVDDVRNDYSRLCTQAGHAQYQLYTINNDLKMINEQLKDLNLEAAAIAAKDAENEQK